MSLATRYHTFGFCLQTGAGRAHPEKKDERNRTVVCLSPSSCVSSRPTAEPDQRETLQSLHYSGGRGLVAAEPPCRYTHFSLAPSRLSASTGHPGLRESGLSRGGASRSAGIRDRRGSSGGRAGQQRVQPRPTCASPCTRGTSLVSERRGAKALLPRNGSRARPAPPAGLPSVLKFGHTAANTSLSSRAGCGSSLCEAVLSHCQSPVPEPAATGRDSSQAAPLRMLRALESSSFPQIQVLLPSSVPHPNLSDR
ncbi:PREDICTED: uncharacterized protein LOC107603347 [Ficedula albicollis]|uniref:uncharacterized protein LOC107603347 n=1 Tax=Ficedula albicollis TaxID=59894 RepID=UPI0007AD7BDC|nr:PREDICTED: uncharacterized protein LOC107603347 [Ficedula albicollis]